MKENAAKPYLLTQRYTLQTVNHVIEGNDQGTPLKKLPFWCEFPTLLLHIKRGVPLVLPSTATTYYGILCITIDKEGCSLVVTLVLSSTVARYCCMLLLLQPIK